MKSINVDGVKYVPEKKSEGKIRIIVLQRGWVLVGRFSRKDSDCLLEDASVIRSWGTTQGLGEIAEGGPTSSTKLDPCHGAVRFDILTMVLSIDCEEGEWEAKL